MPAGGAERVIGVDDARAVDPAFLDRLIDPGDVVVRIPDIADSGEARAQHPPGIYHAQHGPRSEEHTSELQSLMRISYAVFCLKKKKKTKNNKKNKHRKY